MLRKHLLHGTLLASTFFGLGNWRAVAEVAPEKPKVSGTISIIDPSDSERLYTVIYGKPAQLLYERIDPISLHQSFYPKGKIETVDSSGMRCYKKTENRLVRIPPSRQLIGIKAVSYACTLYLFPNESDIRNPSFDKGGVTVGNWQRTDAIYVSQDSRFLSRQQLESFDWSRVLPIDPAYPPEVHISNP
ncbi:hypothetical protein [Pseudobacteriovorax antillogorgiicola]|uniref:Uncharacterized protein n=1 Tax=Pseudobacteriovorax antillogorgiicola TaxID=1513793 RepID=A0A1Y6BDN0_9BACT|nr:hypothetical protein [Pseudobacteriovorax antillogorgiicola]TCS56503.1 hypothetical protein EDD56_104325 [Pseudobacteriovorax antillogorgiicola]SMF04656.1 hypothetical protein SAMN06296036_1048 [Pseudobacteriovorax antillogorgiicola]